MSNNNNNNNNDRGCCFYFYKILIIALYDVVIVLTILAAIDLSSISNDVIATLSTFGSSSLLSIIAASTENIPFLSFVTLLWWLVSAGAIVCIFIYKYTYFISIGAGFTAICTTIYLKVIKSMKNKRVIRSENHYSPSPPPPYSPSLTQPQSSNSQPVIYIVDNINNQTTLSMHQQPQFQSDFASPGQFQVPTFQQPQFYHQVPHHQFQTPINHTPPQQQQNTFQQTSSPPYPDFPPPSYPFNETKF